jgi:hypothetical protein
MAVTQNKYVTHYPTTSSTHLQYYNAPSQQQETPKSSYVQTSTAPSSITTSSDLSQDITSLLMKEQGSDSTKRVLQSSSLADVSQYLSHLPTSLSLHHFLKYSADAANIKKESVVSCKGKNRVHLTNNILFPSKKIRANRSRNLISSHQLHQFNLFNSKLFTTSNQRSQRQPHHPKRRRRRRRQKRRNLDQKLEKFD